MLKTGFLCSPEGEQPGSRGTQSEKRFRLCSQHPDSAGHAGGAGRERQMGSGPEGRWEEKKSHSPSVPRGQTFSGRCWPLGGRLRAQGLGKGAATGAGLWEGDGKLLLWGPRE